MWIHSVEEIGLLCLGIEGTAEKLGVGIVDSRGVIRANIGKPYTPRGGGIHPREAAQHHSEHIAKLVEEAVQKADIQLSDIGLIAFSQGPGLGPCLRVVATAARTLSQLLGVPIIGVNHCVAHVEIGRLVTRAKNPISLYASGGNTQIIIYDEGYRVVGETLDIGVGNCLDKFARHAGLKHPGGPIIEELAKRGKHRPLPYVVKGMNLSFSGIYTAAKTLLESGAPLEDVCFSLQETVFSMMIEVLERAISHFRCDEAMLCGGVAANRRFQEMFLQMLEDRGCKGFIPPDDVLGDNGAMIAWNGILAHGAGLRMSLEETVVRQRYRVDEVETPWRC